MRIAMSLVLAIGAAFFANANAADPAATQSKSDAEVVPLDRQIDLIKQVAPNAKHVGIVYNPGNSDSVAVVKQLQELLPKAGLTLVEVQALHAEDVGSAGRNLIGKVDVIYANTDTTVAAAFESLAQVSYDAKIPLISADTNDVPRGALAALGLSAAPSEATRKLELVINTSAATKEGVALPAQLLQSAARIVK
jgi:putative ABC transport system substrate-binding protein